MVIVYGIMLHLWVLIVIMTYTPEMHTGLDGGDHDHHPVRPSLRQPITQPCALRPLPTLTCLEHCLSRFRLFSWLSILFHLEAPFTM